MAPPCPFLLLVLFLVRLCPQSGLLYLLPVALRFCLGCIEYRCRSWFSLLPMLIDVHGLP